MDIIAAAITGKKGVDGIISDVEKIVDRNLPKLLKGLTKAGKGVSTLIRKGLPKIVKLIKDIAPSVVSRRVKCLCSWNSRVVIVNARFGTRDFVDRHNCYQR